MQALRAFLGFYVFLSGSRPGQTRGPILASDTSKRVFWDKEVPFGVSKNKYFSFHPQNRQKPQFWCTYNAIPMENTNANNVWSVSPIITKFGMQSLMRPPKVQYAPK